MKSAVILSGALLSISLQTAPAETGDTPDHSIQQLVKASLVYDEPAMQEAVTRLAALGRSILPQLLELLDHEDANVRWQTILTLDRIGINPPELLKPVHAACVDADADVRAAAILTLATLFPSHLITLRRIHQLTSDPHELVQVNAWMSLWIASHNTNSVAKLIGFLNARDWMVTRGSEDHLTAIGRAALPLLIEAASNEAFDGRTGALRVLGRIKDDRALKVLADAAQSAEPEVCTAAFIALASLGQPAIPLLAELSVTPEVEQRIRAIEALGNIGADAKPTVPMLTESLKIPRLRVSTLTAIGRIGWADPCLGKELLKFLTFDSPDVRAACAAAIGQLESKPPGWEKPLRGLASNDPKDYVRQAARKSLEPLTSTP